MVKIKYLILSILFFWLGFKLSQAVNVYREVRNVKFIETTVNKILNRNEDIIVFDRKSKEKKEQEENEDYKEFLKFKAMKGDV